MVPSIVTPLADGMPNVADPSDSQAVYDAVVDGTLDTVTTPFDWTR